jgi:hypothetical protein
MQCGGTFLTLHLFCGVCLIMVGQGHLDAGHPVAAGFIDVTASSGLVYGMFTRTSSRWTRVVYLD